MDGGIYINPSWAKGSRFDFGLTWKTRKSVGADASVQIELGATGGSAENLNGKTINTNVGAGLFEVTGTIVLDENTKAKSWGFTGLGSRTGLAWGEFGLIIPLKV